MGERAVPNALAGSLGTYSSYWIVLPSLNTREVVSLVQLDMPCFVNTHGWPAPPLS